jgi:hypothetical protein
MDNCELSIRLTKRPDLIEKMIETLKFYGDGDFYHWEGCHCHGNYEFEKGDKAESVLYEIQSQLWDGD